ncbi:HAD family hydrolase, partial [Acinetobacter baumannii]
TAEAVGRQLGMDEVIANVMPEDKASIVKDQQAKNQRYRIGKPSSFEDVPQYFTEKVDVLGNEGKTVVLVAVDEEVVGLIALMDQPQEDAHKAIEYFKEQGIHTSMISGDAKLTAEAVGRQLGMDEVIANVMPEDKASIVKDQQAK